MIDIRKVETEDLVGNFFGKFREIYCKFHEETDFRNKLANDDAIKNQMTGNCKTQFWHQAIMDDQIVGFSALNYYRDENDNDESWGYARVYVESQEQRQGIGSKLFEPVISKASELGLKSMLFSTYSKESARFLENYGAKLLSTSSDRILEMVNVDWAKVGEWLSISKPEKKWNISKFDNVNAELISMIGDLSFDVTNEMRLMDGMKITTDRHGHLEWLGKLDGFFKNDNMQYVSFVAC